MRIVVADDDAVTTMMLEAYLLQLGHEVAVASDGCAALELLQDNDYRVLITDWEMPNMDGLELCRRIRDRFCRMGRSVPHSR